MSQFKAQKVVASLPGTLETNTMYLVRVGVGFDMYVTNDQGTIVAYPINQSTGGGGLTEVQTKNIARRYAIKL